MTTTRLPHPGTGQSSWTGRSNISIFVHCLHLLDLDLLDDWPSLTEQTFSAKTAQQTQQHRIKAVEWCLYRLFELYDPTETKDKLRPFFPPLAPLQSLNLRAALYRCLTELKKKGMLGKEILLRKTMLDECKGDKFEETIAAFGMIVLRKKLKSLGGAMRGVVAGNVTADQTVPLILAYRKSLQNNLDRRNALRQGYQSRMNRFEIAEQELDRRIEEVESHSTTISPETSRELEALVNTNWIGDQRWVETLLHGPPIKPVIDVGHPTDPTTISKKTSCDSVGSSTLLDDLDAKIHKHQNRLAQWRDITKDLQTMIVASESVTEAPKPTKDVQNRFSMHQDLHVDKAPQTLSLSDDTAPQYQTILDNMRQEMTLKGRRRVIENSLRPQEEEEGLLTPILPPSHSISTKKKQETAATEHAPFPTPNLDISATNTESHSPIPSSPVSSLVDDTSSNWIPEHISSATATKSESPRPGRITRSPPPQEINDKETDQPSSPTKDWLSLMDRTRVSIASSGQYKHPLDSDPIDESMAEIPSALDEEDGNSPIIPSSTPPLPLSSDTKATLMERTRQSMSLLSNLSNHSNHPRNRTNRPTMSHSKSQSHPVNQFETPRRRSNSAKQEVLQLPESTFSPTMTTTTTRSAPHDNLFDNEADYASVFKSRPKIALSPALSPEQKIVESEAEHVLGLEREMEQMNLHSG